MRAAAMSRLPDMALARRAAAWLAFLAVFFYATYGASNWYASTRPDVGSVVTFVDRLVPFLPWTIVPYWSINLFYALSLFVCVDRPEMDRLAGRLLTAQVVAVACFVLFPLEMSYVRPETNGLPGFLFEVLGGFDRPYNQAPSLHIALLVILWDHFRGKLGGMARAAWHGWCVLIAISVLTTWQHHFVDVPTGALLGLFALWLFPRGGDLPFAGFVPTAAARAQRLAFAYGAGGLVLFAIVLFAPISFAVSMWLLWPALALVIVAIGYAGAGPAVFQKAADGRVTLAARLLLFPVRAGARINAWAWTRRLRKAVPVGVNVFLGSHPAAAETGDFASVVDLAAELERPRSVDCRWVSLPCLDLVPADPAILDRAVLEIERMRKDGPVLVCCALGFQRSAEAVVRWMLLSGRAADRTDALALIAKAGRPIHVHEPAMGAAGGER